MHFDPPRELSLTLLESSKWGREYISCVTVNFACKKLLQIPINAKTVPDDWPQTWNEVEQVWHRSSANLLPPAFYEIGHSQGAGMQIWNLGKFKQSILMRARAPPGSAWQNTAHLQLPKWGQSQSRVGLSGKWNHGVGNGTDPGMLILLILNNQSLSFSAVTDSN